MWFQKIDRMNGTEVKSKIEFTDCFEAYKNVDAMFNRQGVFSMEARDYQNGTKTLTLRDNKNKILYQLKMLTHA